MPRKQIKNSRGWIDVPAVMNFLIYGGMYKGGGEGRDKFSSSIFFATHSFLFYFLGRRHRGCKMYSTSIGKLRTEHMW